ncbi:MAG: hypothetical protein BRC58_06830 [Cyanobacteria bacterium QS_8_64_29]|jgi:YggT family protein|nr:MAG: hypothetical protein BRC58_06830 [Cyanobacteria bacterium QS_8_64_29]
MSASNLLTDSLANFLNIYLLLILVRIVLSWFQTAGWAQQGMAYLSPVTDPYLNIFRSFIPPLGGLDLSPIVGIILLQIVASILQTA